MPAAALPTPARFSPLTITARNGTGTTTANYDGSYTGSLAKQVTLSDANASAGSFGPTNPLAANTFVLGVANLATTPSVKFTFTTKTTAPATLLVRAGDADTLAQTPAGGTAVEGSVALRSGRLRLMNAYGSDQIDLALPFETQYWNGSAFIKNTLDSCTTLIPANIVLGNKQGGLTALHWSHCGECDGGRCGHHNPDQASRGDQGKRGCRDGTGFDRQPEQLRQHCGRHRGGTIAPQRQVVRGVLRP
jgi:hypothetical protein